jgi:hypothetical protein
MAAKKKKSTKSKIQDRQYSYDEYRKAFYPKPQPSPNPQEPEVFGAKLAEETLRQIKQEEDGR